MTFQRADLIQPRDYKNKNHFVDKNWKFPEVNPQQKLILEAGSGSGHWIEKEALKNPNKIYIAVEKTKERSEKLINKSKHIPNLHTIRADVLLYAEKMIPLSSLDEIYFFHPNPWPKKQQSNKRYFVASSYKILHDRLKEKGEVYCVSNTPDYIKEAKDFLEQFWRYKIIQMSPLDPQSEGRTLFEKKYLERGEEIWELRAQKIS